MPDERYPTGYQIQSQAFSGYPADRISGILSICYKWFFHFFYEPEVVGMISPLLAPLRLWPLVGGTRVSPTTPLLANPASNNSSILTTFFLEIGRWNIYTIM